MHSRDAAPLDTLRRLAGSLVPPTGAPHRVNHGGSAWSLPSRQRAETQPQDGSRIDPERIAEISTAANGWRITGESDDARITGGTRSLSRRVMGLNVTAESRARETSIPPKSAKTVSALVA